MCLLRCEKSHILVFISIHGIGTIWTLLHANCREAGKQIIIITTLMSHYTNVLRETTRLYHIWNLLREPMLFFFPKYLVDYPNITSDAKVYTSLWTKTYNWSLYIIIIIILLHEGNCLSEQEECFAMLFILASKTMFLFTSLLHS